MLPVLLQQRRQLLAYLESSVAEVSKCCMPSAEPPVTCLECPLHDEDCTPHVLLNINEKEVLVCHERVLVTPLPEKSYILLYDYDWPDTITTGNYGINVLCASFTTILPLYMYLECMPKT